MARMIVCKECGEEKKHHAKELMTMHVARHLRTALFYAEHVILPNIINCRLRY